MSRVSGKPYFLYVLWSPSGQRFYIGISEDSEHRLAQPGFLITGAPLRGGRS